jgi:hypothetical protein
MASNSDMLGVPSPSEGLTPNTRTEAEAALTYNALRQTISAASPQPTTPALKHTDNPLATRLAPSSSSSTANSSDPNSLLPEPPYPSEDTAELVRGNLSRGTTQAVLQKMDVGLDGTSLLAKRMSRDSASTGAADGVPAGGSAKPVFNRQQSYSKEDMKRMMSERLMSGDAPHDGQGYSSVN